MSIIYKEAIVLLVAYGSKILEWRINEQHTKAILLFCYGTCCRVIAKYYRTASFLAAGVIAGIHPLDMEIKRFHACRKIKKEEEL